jgi:hypothetical protein
MVGGKVIFGTIQLKESLLRVCRQNPNWRVVERRRQEKDNKTAGREGRRWQRANGAVDCGLTKLISHDVTAASTSSSPSTFTSRRPVLKH